MCFAVLSTVINIQFFGVFSPCYLFYSIRHPHGNFEIKTVDLPYETQCEFKKNKGFFGSAYYIFFILRRLFYSLTQIFLLNHPIAQAYLNVFFALIMALYVIYFRPFKEKLMNFVQITAELCVLIVFSVSSLFLFSPSEEFSKVIEDICIYTIFIEIGIQFMVSFYCFIRSLFKFYKDLEKSRAMEFLKSAHTIRDF